MVGVKKGPRAACMAAATMAVVSIATDAIGKAIEYGTYQAFKTYDKISKKSK